MGKILQYFLSDNLGKPLVMIGAGRILEMVQNYSGDKISERLVLNVLIEFNDSTTKQVVIKLGLSDSDFSQKSNESYKSKLSGNTYNNLTFDNEYFHETLIANILKENLSDSNMANKILTILGAGTVTDNNILINGESFNLSDLISFNPQIASSDNITYLVTEYNPSYKILLKDGIPERWLSETQEKFYNLINSGIDILEYAYGKYKFCHWDYHGGNIIYDNDNGLIKLFDFDLSSIDGLNSQYIDRVSYFYTIIDNIINSQGIFSNTQVLKSQSYENIKSMIAHYFDLFQFLHSIQKKYLLSYFYLM